MHYLNSLSDVMNKLREKGYKENYRLENDKLVDETGNEIPKNKLKLENTYRFEGMSNPSDMSILYELTSETGDKIMLIDSYAGDSDKDISKFVESI
jgi:hypothetical protein